MSVKIFIPASFLFFSLCASAQVDTLVKKLDSLSQTTDSSGRQINNINDAAYNEKNRITFPTYFILMGSTLKQEFTAPFHWNGSNWKKFGLFAAATGALTLLDEPVQRTALDLRRHNESLKTIGNFVTNFGGRYEAYTLGALGAYGFLFKNEKLKATTLLATQAYIAAGAVGFVGKFIFGRLRPNYYDSTALEQEPKFTGPFGHSGYDANGRKLNSSFPSGHTTVAFAAATVFAKEYKDKPIVPVIAYTAATLVGISRITENKHWTTDVLSAAALGYFSGKLVVNNFHRYAKIKSPGSQPSISLTVTSLNGRPAPEIIYHF